MVTDEQKKEELLQQYRKQQQQDEYLRRKSGMMPKNIVSSLYNTASDIGRAGQLMSSSKNPLVSNLGSNLYKYSGREGMDALRDNALSKINNAFAPHSNTAMTNTIANNAMGDLSATPTINNPASTSLASGFGGATTPTIANPTGATTLANFGTQGTTALNSGALASSSPLSTAIASEASGAGLGAANAGLGALGTEAATTAGAGSLAGAGTATAGTGAAMGGAGAAGAAGGAAATGAAAAVPVIGWAVAAASLIYNMLKSAKQKRDQKALQENLKANAQAKQIADEQTNEAIQNLDNLSAEQNQGVTGQLPQLPGTNIAQGQPDPSQYRTTGNNSVGLASNVENGAGLVSDLMNMYKGEDATSLPTPTPTPDTTPHPQPNTSRISDAPVLDTLSSKLANQSNNSFSLPTPMVAGANINPVGRNATDTYNYIDNNMQNELPSSFDFINSAANSGGIYTDLNDRMYFYPQDTQSPTISAEGVSQEAPQADENTALKGSLMDNVKNGLRGFKEGYDDNANTSLLEGDLANGRRGDKTIAQKLGEAFGTGSRILKNPYVQGGIAGTLYGIDKGDGLYGLGKGFEWAQNRMKNNAYTDALRKAGVNIPNTFLGGLTGTDANAIANLDMLPAKKDYYSNRALSAKALANKNAGLKSDGTPYTYKDLANAYKSKTELNNAIENGEISLDDTFDFNLFQEAVKSRQVGNKTVENNNSSRKLDLIEQGKPTNITQMNVIKSDKDGLKASENYLKGAEIKAGAKGNNPPPQNKSVPSTPAMPSNSNSNALNTNGKTSSKKGAAAKIKEKIDKLYPRFDKNGKRINYTTSGGVNYRIV